MPAGIEKLNLYAGKLVADALDLAEARGRDRAVIRDQVMLETRSVVPLWEDAVTLAVNAADRLLAPEDLQDIELLIVGTESAVDFAKPISTWVHRFCGLLPKCRNLEVKHACYGGTGALKMAAAWVDSGARPGKKALVISSDFTRRYTRDEYDYVGGGCAVAMLVSAQPDILELDPTRTGYWTSDVYDAYRPTCRIEAVDNQLSLFSYLDALDGSFRNYMEACPGTNYDTDFARHIYHAPFPGMALQAHRTVLSGLGVTGKTPIRESFNRKVREGLCLGQRLGTAYGSSNFLSLLSLLAAKNVGSGDRISIFSYGSGCQGEFYDGVIGRRAIERAEQINLDQLLHERWPISVEDYERIECLRNEQLEAADCHVNQASLPEAYEALYRDKGLLVLQGIHEHRRSYGRS